MTLASRKPPPHPTRLRLSVAAISTLVAYLLLLSSCAHGKQLSVDLLKRTTPLLLALAATYGTAGWWAVQTWQALWRTGRDKWERVVFDYGVKGFGLCTAVTITVTLGWLGWSTTVETGDRLWFAAGLLTGAVVGLPVSLHLGYFWGVAFAKAVGINPTPASAGPQAPNHRWRGP